MRGRFMDKVRGSYYPRTVVVVQCAATATYHPSTPDVLTEHLNCWHAWMTRSTGKGGPSDQSAAGPDAPGFWRWLDSACKSGGEVWVVCLHGARTLALLEFWGLLESGKLTLSGTDPRDKPAAGKDKGRQWHGYCVLADPPTVVVCRAPGRPYTLRIVDVRNYGPECQADLTPDGAADIPEAPPDPCDQSGRLNWCREAGLRIAVFFGRMTTFLKENDLGSLQSTVASQALTTFRRQFLNDPIYVHDDEPALALERDAYFGGRCEAFYMGKAKGTVYVLDFRSLYPSVCVSNPLPTLLREVKGPMETEELRALCLAHLCIADVDLISPAASYPLRRGRHAVYPTGRFRTALCGPELIEALNNNHVLRAHRVALYDGNTALKEYMTTLYAHRMTVSNAYGPAVARFVKGLLVNLPGKLAQRDRRWIDQPEEIADHPYTVWWRRGEGDRLERYRSLGWTVQKEIDAGEGAHSCPAVAAWITSLGRLHLLRVLRVAGRRRTFYCDTDSIHCTEGAYRDLEAMGWVRENDLGYLRLVQVAQEAEYLRPKHYILDGRLTCSGLPRVDHGLACSPYEAWVRQALHQQAASGARPASTFRRLDLRDRHNYPHGRVGKDGFVRPFDIRDG